MPLRIRCDICDQTITELAPNAVIHTRGTALCGSCSPTRKPKVEGWTFSYRHPKESKEDS